ncbi:flagellar basal body rod protein [Nitrococcus mobilis Nb-231]|uniref:Flagellar basal-body rod protein FlgC n=2 Tax=Nitrococcus mobilis TaxID=35797 RepID=A4BQE8_9GAMM|nr:flagellar basal body rod protein [Nitrococcus mobilis Nb-231]
MIMALFDIFDVAGSAMSAQALRLNITASNMANADTVASTPERAYKARQPVFAAALNTAHDTVSAVPVQLRGVVTSSAAAEPLYQPNNPLADADGYVYRSNVNTVEAMVNMISASRSYQNNVEVVSTSRDLLLQTLRLGR